MTDRQTSLTLRVGVDQNEVNRGVKALQTIDAAYNNYRKSLQKINEDATKASEGVKNLQKQAESAARATTKAGGGFSIDRAEGLLGRTGAALSGIGLGSAGGTVSGAADALQLILQGKEELAGLGATSGAAATGAKALIVSLGPLALVVGAAAVASALWNEQLKKNEIEQTKAITALKTYYEVIATGTRDTVGTQLEQAKRDLQSAKDLQAAYQAERDKAFQSENRGFLGDTRARLVELGGANKTYSEALEGQKKTVLEAEARVTGLTKAYDSSAVAANTAKEAEKQLADQRTKARIEAFGSGLGNEVQAAQMIQEGNLEATKNAIQSRQTELSVIREWLAKNAEKVAGDEKLAEVYDQAEKRAKELEKQIQSLNNTVLPAVSSIAAYKEALEKANEAFKSYEGTLKQANELGRDIAKMEADRDKELKRRADDDKRQAERRGIERSYQARIEEAKREDAIQDARDKAAQNENAAVVEHGQAIDKVNQDFFDGELKAYRDYIEAEQRTTEQANLQRLRTLEDAQLDLQQLAARGDVAGFIERSTQAKIQIKRQAEDANIAANERQRDFERQTEEARAARDKQLEDLQASFEEERAARQADAQTRIAEIEAQGQENNSRAAQLEQELNAIREQWREEDLKRQRDLEQESYDERLSLQRQKQDEMLAESQAFLDEWLAQLQRARDGSQTSTPAPYAGGYEIQEYATGLPYVPRDGYMASLHEGERIMTRQQNYDYTRGGGSGGGDTYQVSVNNTVGDIATKSMLDEYQQETVAGIQEGIRQAKGRGA